MNKEQYEALAALRTETMKKALEIYSSANLHIDFNFHELDPTAEIWKFQKNSRVNKDGSRNYLTNRSFSRINLYSKSFK
ncbi:hypothetical protein BST83_13195 [Polaribacter filamentus]|uniref:Uncharacterized protein n=1 Tax=Polaribacter filamentus TaxID=53483 RepID=A0A2S7KZF1_9FLAO|nr:hypothetical protein [Polaribacter filamentus]PQB08000.1 hypothetical protein BST83_13195 [Polaribacter filamentus]